MFDFVEFGDINLTVLFIDNKSGKFFLIREIQQNVFQELENEHELLRKIKYNGQIEGITYNVKKFDDEEILKKMKRSRLIDQGDNHIMLISVNSLHLFLKNYSAKFSPYTRLYDIVHQMRYKKEINIHSREAEKKKRKRTLTEGQKKHVASRQNYHCRMCKDSFGTPGYEIDHIIPFSEGGSDDFENLQALCPNCHSEKTVDDRLLNMGLMSNPNKNSLGQIHADTITEPYTFNSKEKKRKSIEVSHMTVPGTVKKQKLSHEDIDLEINEDETIHDNLSGSYEITRISRKSSLISRYEPESPSKIEKKEISSQSEFSPQRKKKSSETDEEEALRDLLEKYSPDTDMVFDNTHTRKEKVEKNDLIALLDLTLEEDTTETESKMKYVFSDSLRNLPISSTPIPNGVALTFEIDDSTVSVDGEKEVFRLNQDSTDADLFQDVLKYEEVKQATEEPIDIIDIDSDSDSYQPITPPISPYFGRNSEKIDYIAGIKRKNYNFSPFTD